jgi:hypothetical protein
MAIEYTKVNPSEIATDVMKQRALEAEERAYIAQVEATRQERILAITPPGEAHAELESSLRNQRMEAEKSARKAQRANGAAPLSDNDRANVHAGFLAKWIEVLEKQHAAHSAIRNEQNRLLELNGKSGLAEDEKAEAEKEKTDAEVALKEIEVAHELAIELQEEVTAQMAVAAEAAGHDHDHGHGHDHPVHEDRPHLEPVPD